MTPAATGVPLVEVRGLTRRFPGVVANDNVSFAIHAGEVHALLGENGAGKSTLIAMLAGMQQPDAGSILIDGRGTRIASPRQALALGMGTVFQHRLLVPSLTVAENLLLGAAWWRRPRRAAASARLREAAADFGMTIDPSRKAGDLSLGEQQRVEIIRALWRGARVLVLDEPTAMLAPSEIAALGSLLRRLARTGVGIVFITHKLDEALDFADRITVLRQGRVVSRFAPQALHGGPRPALRTQIVACMFGADATTPKPLRTRRVAGTVLSVRDLSTPATIAGPSLAGITFDLAAGEILGIAGIDGNGQTLLAEALAGQVRSSGRIVLAGQDLHAHDVAERHRLGLRYLSDDRLGEATISAFPVSMNLLLNRIGDAPFWQRGIAQPEVIARHAGELIARFDIRAPGPDTPIGRLSGGNIQKVLLARALADGARVVVFNKPTHGLDLRSTVATRARIAEIAAAGVAVMLISSDLDEILDMADRIGVMAGGQLVGMVTAGEHARGQVGRLMAGAAGE